MSAEEMTKIHERLTAQDNKLDAIHMALVGNPSLGHRGLVARVESNESWIKDHNNKLIRWGGIVTGAGLAVQILKDKLVGGQ